MLRLVVKLVRQISLMKPIKTLKGTALDGGIYIVRLLSDEKVPNGKHKKKPLMVNSDFFKIGQFTKGPETRFAQYRVIFEENIEMDVFVNGLDNKTTLELEQNILNVLHDYRVSNCGAITEWVTNISYDKIVDTIKKEAKKLNIFQKSA